MSKITTVVPDVRRTTFVWIPVFLFMSSAVSQETILPSLAKREFLPPAMLATFLEVWDSALDEGLYVGGARMIGRISVWWDVGPGKPRGRILRYGNPEIVERVLRLYIAEYQLERRADMLAYERAIASGAQFDPEGIHKRNYERTQTLLARSIAQDTQLYREADVDEVARKGDPEADYLHGEKVADYVMHLASLAESTLSPKIHDYVWGYPLPGDWWRVYLGTVLPERTIELLVRATRAECLGSPRPLGINFLFRHDTGAGINVSDGMYILAQIVENRPALAKTQREPILGFVRKYARIYYETRSEVPYYSGAPDYRTRFKALEILERLGGEKDIPLLESIAADAPAKAVVEDRRKRPSDQPYPEIAEKAAEIIDALR